MLYARLSWEDEVWCIISSTCSRELLIKITPSLSLSQFLRKKTKVRFEETRGFQGSHGWWIPVLGTKFLPLSSPSVSFRPFPVTPWHLSHRTWNNMSPFLDWPYLVGDFRSQSAYFFAKRAILQHGSIEFVELTPCQVHTDALEAFPSHLFHGMHLQTLGGKILSRHIDHHGYVRLTSLFGWLLPPAFLRLVASTVIKLKRRRWSSGLRFSHHFPG